MDKEFLRRREAGVYLKEKYGIGSSATLAKLATVGGGPIFRKVGNIPVYTPQDLDAWVKSRLSGPVASTTTEAA